MVIAISIFSQRILVGGKTWNDPDFSWKALSSSNPTTFVSVAGEWYERKQGLEWSWMRLQFLLKSMFLSPPEQRQMFVP
jgi:hypothetical protein